MNTLFVKAIDNQDEVLNPIFVVGCPRSGTSVLARGIAKSGLVCYLEEQGLVQDFYARIVPLSLSKTYIQDSESIAPLIKAKIKQILDHLMGTG